MQEILLFILKDNLKCFDTIESTLLFHLKVV
jgi:hypothetical protein